MTLNTNLINNLISIFIVLILGFSFKVFPTSALGDVDWLLLKENQDGKEWLDLGSIKKLKNDQIRVLTKFYENPKIEKEKGKTTLYVMKINCISKEHVSRPQRGIIFKIRIISFFHLHSIPSCNQVIH